MKATQKIVSLNAITIDGVEYPAKYKTSKTVGSILVLYGEDFRDYAVIPPYDDAFIPAWIAAQYAIAAERSFHDRAKRLADALADALEHYYNGDGKAEPETQIPFALLYAAV